MQKRPLSKIGPLPTVKASVKAVLSLPANLRRRTPFARIPFSQRRELNTNSPPTLRCIKLRLCSKTAEMSVTLLRRTY